MQLTIGERIRQRRKELNLTQKELSRRMKGISHVAISQWESSTTKPNAENLYDLSNVLGCEPSWLLRGVKDNVGIANINPNGTRIPILDYKSLEQWHSAQLFELEKGVEYIMTDLSVSSLAFAYSILSDAMEPDFIEGDIVIIDPSVKPEPGEFVLARDHNTIIFRKYREDGINQENRINFVLIPLNQDYAQILSSATDVQILGTMVEHRIYRRKR